MVAFKIKDVNLVEMSQVKHDKFKWIIGLEVAHLLYLSLMPSLFIKVKGQNKKTKCKPVIL